MVQRECKIGLMKAMHESERELQLRRRVAQITFFRESRVLIGAFHYNVWCDVRRGRRQAALKLPAFYGCLLLVTIARIVSLGIDMAIVRGMALEPIDPVEAPPEVFPSPI